jgi:hypothetical protein
MTIIRAPRPERNFYMLDKAISEDKRLSWSARGLLIFLLGKPDHWKVSVPALVNETAEAARSTGRDAVYNLLAELIDTGYVQRVKRADGALEYIVSEPNPENPDVAPEPLPEKPDPEKPDPDFQDALVITDKAASIEVKPSTEALSAPTPSAEKAKSKKRTPTSLQAFMDECKARGERVMPDDDPLTTWGEKVGVPFDLLNLAWVVFKNRYLEDPSKRQSDWRAHFRTAVKSNWYHLWYFDARGDCFLTTAGEQARRAHDAGLMTVTLKPETSYATKQEQIKAQNEATMNAFLFGDGNDPRTIDMESTSRRKQPKFVF